MILTPGGFETEAINEATKDNASRTCIAFTQILIISVMWVIAAIPDDLLLAVTLALTFAVEGMTAESHLNQVIGSCKTMTSVSVLRI